MKDKVIALSNKERIYLVKELLSSTDSVRNWNFDEEEITLKNLDDKKASNFDMDRQEFFLIKTLLKKLSFAIVEKGVSE